MTLTVGSGQVTVVIPCYNAQDWVARAVASVATQGDVVQNIIVVNDGSTDGSLDVLRPLAEAGQITLLSGPNQGGCHARNCGLSAVSTPFVMFLDADDEITGPMLESAVQRAQETPADLIFSGMEIRYPNDRKEWRDPMGPPEKSAADIFEGWFDGDWLSPCAVLWRTDFIREIGGWDETLTVGQDGELVMRALMKDARLARNDKGFGIYYRGLPGSVSMGGGVTPRKLNGMIDLIMQLNVAARDKGWGDRLERNHAAVYFLARKAFSVGHMDIGRRALALLHEADHHRHHGSRAHVVLAGLVGLERKQRWLRGR